MEEDDDWLNDESGQSYRHQGGAADPLVDAEWNRLATRYSDAGYREGITDGKLATLQQGFDQGFNSSVLASRRLGQLRGRANGLLSFLLKTDIPAQNGSSSADPARVDLTISNVREFVRLLGNVKRDDILPLDTERLEHERNEHPDQDHAFEFERNDKRDMEGLEDAMRAVSSGGDIVGPRPETRKENTDSARDASSLDALERQLIQLEAAIIGDHQI
ncbi:hypothetical protein BD324DRAFT_577392 [Kockovaella imperatae]|uniref:Protein YAE1 n=1 Tax=Kockovaella imperatae TaxID=4999 RepID=A0A1Y1UMX6_9TREE|nr:hypothetical protein BD324DRAFT_577392 [Kockovaella imperatae]ORX38867.1 hypothetical protein BD324DRAFT_577392 [Kockovaella imperatae]